MLDKSLEDILKVADDLGIEYEADSENAGFFIVEPDGTERKMSIQEIMMIDQIKI